MSDEPKTPDQDTTPKAGEGSQPPTKPNPTDTQPPMGKVEGDSAAQPKKADPKTEGQPERIVPEKYELKVPDGSVMDPKHLAEVSEYAKANKLTNDEAQAVLNRDNGLLSSFAKAQQEQLAQASHQWIEDAKSDKEIGGEAFVKNVELAKRVVEKFGSDSLKKDLDTTGFGNHPELVRLLVRIGKTMSEDTFVPAGSQAGAKKSPVEVLYGKPTENKGE